MGVFLLTALTAGISILSGISTGLSGFGAAIIFQSVWLVLGQLDLGDDDVGVVKISSAVLSFVSPSTAAAALYLSRNTRGAVLRDVVTGSVPVLLVTAVVGVFILSKTDSRTLVLVLGVCFLLLVCLWYQKLLRGMIADAENEAQEEQALTPPRADDGRLLQRASTRFTDVERGTTECVHYFRPVPDDAHVRPKDEPAQPGWRTLVSSDPWCTGDSVLAMLAAVVSGVLAGLFGTGGPPFMFLFGHLSQRRKLTKTQIRATYSMNVVFQMFARVGAGFALGIYRTQDIPLYIAGPIFTIGGTHVGHYFHESVDRNTVLLFLNVLVVTSAMLLAKPGFGLSDSGFDLVLAILGLAFAIIAVVIVVYASIRYRRAFSTLPCCQRKHQTGEPRALTDSDDDHT